MRPTGTTPDFLDYHARNESKNHSSATCRRCGSRVLIPSGTNNAICPSCLATEIQAVQED